MSLANLLGRMSAADRPGTGTNERSSPPSFAGSSPALSVCGVRREIDGRAIVDDASFQVREGELFVLVGPSGCGKSTLLRMIAGLDPPAQGHIRLGDEDITSEPPERRRIGLVFQDHALFPHRRIDQNIAFGIPHLSRSERTRRVGELLDLVRLPDMAKRYPHELSGGEQQRVALVRALAPDPAVVLLDEPFASLDPTLREEVRADVVGALRARSAAAVLVTHDRDEALALGDRIAVMNRGRILQVGTPYEMYEQPVDRFVAEFLGEASFLSDPDVGPNPDSDAGLRTVLLARPHHLGLEVGGSDVVIGRRYLGATWRYELRRFDGTTVEVEQASDPTTPPLEIGAKCSIEVSASHPLHRLQV